MPHGPHPWPTVLCSKKFKKRFQTRNFEQDIINLKMLLFLPFWSIWNSKKFCLLTMAAPLIENPFCWAWVYFLFQFFEEYFSLHFLKRSFTYVFGKKVLACIFWNFKIKGIAAFTDGTRWGQESTQGQYLQDLDKVPFLLTRKYTIQVIKLTKALFWRKCI